MKLKRSEYYILKGTDFNYDFIGRDDEGHIYLEGDVGKLVVSCYDHLFKTIEIGNKFDILELLRENDNHDV